MKMLGQVAIRSSSGTTYCPLQGQGATEYLVLLAVVLIVALVSVTLLGFFPGMASDAQKTQSDTYWQSAAPVAIVESAARVMAGSGTTYLHLRVKNTGAYPIRITEIVGGDGIGITEFSGYDCGLSYPPNSNISDYYYLGPGEEKYFSTSSLFGAPCSWQVRATTGASATRYVGGASSICQNSSASPGMLDYNAFGFEYIEYIDGQQITKRQMGKDLIIKCLPPV